MKRIFAVIMALMMILSTTSQAYVVTVYGQNCTYTMTSPENREIILNDSEGNVRWWKVEDDSHNIIGVIDDEFITPSSDVEVTPMLNGNQIVVQQTANGTIKYNGNVVNTVETTENQSYTLAITPNSGYEIATVKVDNVELSESQITTTGMNYTFNSVTANHVIRVTFKKKEFIQPNADTSGANAPVIADGLTPVNWNGSSWEPTTSNWKYNYNSVATATQTKVEGNGDSAWANAQTADGSLYVWIPRYTYKITSGYNSSGNSWNADSNPGTNQIEIIFSTGTTDTVTSTTGLSKDGYIKHPAFTLGNDELEGIWVAKYKASRNDATASSAGSGTTISSKPGVVSWRSLSLSDMFDNAYNLNRDLDSHLMKNVEWGAVAYLSNAIGRIPYINNGSVTGNAGGTQGADQSTNGFPTYEWDTANGVKASTTHNVYGIYDMSGGAYEYVAAYYTGGESQYLSGDTTNKTYAGSLYLAANDQYVKETETGPYLNTSKYVDTYSTLYSPSNLGDAVYETSGNGAGASSWDGDGTWTGSYANPIIRRGGNVTNGNTAGVFCIDAGRGKSEDFTGFRPVLAVKSNNGGAATPTTYTVTFNANGGNGTMTSQTFTEGTAQNLSANTFTRTGYTFAGWTTTEGGTTVNYTNQASFTATGNTTLYAVWESSIGTPNAPVIADGLTPVKWNGSSWVTTNINDSEWYNYEIASNEDGTEKEGVASGEIAKWANAQTADGSMYVWIPRYTYKITSGNHQTVDSWNADSGDNKTGKIEIKFSNGTTDYTDNDTPEDTTDDYLTHPAFTFGTKETTEGTTEPVELKGIWVAKYEASRNDATESSAGSGTTVSSKPGVVSWRSLSVSNMFDNAYNLNRSLDSHLMKNVEWGAVAYLTNAIGRIPYINNSSSYITGNAGRNQDAGSASGTTNEWSTPNGVKASTTHNVYGIYDMSGGADECVAAYYTGGHTDDLSGDTTNKEHAGSLYLAANNQYVKETETGPYLNTSKYVDTYDTAYTSTKLGDAVYETSSSGSAYTSWDGDSSFAPHSTCPVFRRGGVYTDTSQAGVFCFRNDDGNSFSYLGFRPVLAIP